MSEQVKDKSDSKLQELLEDSQYTTLPKLGELVKGTVIDAAKSIVHIDISGVTTGVVRGKELFDGAHEYTNLKPGDEVEATVIDLENENGEIELSFSYAGKQKIWAELRRLQEADEVTKVTIVDANRGGLMVKMNNVMGFLPVSQLSAEHYPRVPGGDKNKILEKLKSYIGKSFDVKVLDAIEDEEKLIVSEKSVWEEQLKEKVSEHKVGDVVKAKVIATTDFGVFVEFGDKLEGLIHISELAWQRIDDPKDIFKVGDTIKAQVIEISNNKIFLSTKRLREDPWLKIDQKYKTGDVVTGLVLKANPFGLFVELDPDIHGLAHISELSYGPINNVNDIAKPGDKIKLKIISIDAKNHRLGLSLKALKDKPVIPSADKPSPAEKTPARTGAETQTAAPASNAASVKADGAKDNSDQKAEPGEVK